MKFQSTHIINLLRAFKDDRNLYFEFEIGPNGSLDDLIKKCKGKIGEDVAKLLFAQFVNFLEFI